MGRNPTAALAASLLVSGVMLGSCAGVSGTPEPDRTATVLERIQAQVEDLDQRLCLVERLEPRITALEAQARTAAAPEQPVAPGTGNTTNSRETASGGAHMQPTQLYNSARSLLLEENFPGAARLFKNFVIRYPDSELADNALYWLGECHYSLGDFQEAIQTFKDVVALYPHGGKVADALLKTAYAYLSLDDADRAHHYLKLVVKGYPFTPAGEKAEQKLKAFQ